MNELEVTNDFIEELSQIEELQTTLAVSDMERMSGIGGGLLTIVCC